MGKIHLYTGGARSGKSSAAQNAILSFQDVGYIATAINTDAEMADRIQKHQQSRPAEWKTYESPYDIARTIEQTGHMVYLIDCVTVYINNLIFEKVGHLGQDERLTSGQKRDVEEHVRQSIDALISAMKQKEAMFYIVTNEVGMGVIPPTQLGRLFQDVAGFANQSLAKQADSVTFMVSGLPIRLKEST